MKRKLAIEQPPISHELAVSITNKQIKEYFRLCEKRNDNKILVEAKSYLQTENIPTGGEQDFRE